MKIKILKLMAIKKIKTNLTTKINIEISIIIKIYEIYINKNEY